MQVDASVWFLIAEDDLDTAKHCFQGRKYPWAMFMCQQAVEKALKAVYVQKNGGAPPRKHDLISLAGSAGVLDGCTEDVRDLLRRLSLSYTETRYPDKRAAFEAKCTRAYAEDMIERTEDVLEWLRDMLK